MEPTTRADDIPRSRAYSAQVRCRPNPVLFTAPKSEDRSMAKRIVWFVAGLIAWSAGSASAACSCQCVEGVARTACTSVEEARRNPSACGAGAQKVACDVPPPSTEAPLRYASPEGAVDCRSARLWDPRSNAYSAVAKVCDLDRDAAAGG
jgi:hypothetical protein